MLCYAGVDDTFRLIEGAANNPGRRPRDGLVLMLGGSGVKQPTAAKAKARKVSNPWRKLTLQTWAGDQLAQLEFSLYDRETIMSRYQAYSTWFYKARNDLAKVIGERPASGLLGSTLEPTDLKGTNPTFRDTLHKEIRARVLLHRLSGQGK